MRAFVLAICLAICSCRQGTIFFVIDHKVDFGQNKILYFQFLMVYKRTKDKMHGTETSINQLL